jgi:hypothetical protein
LDETRARLKINLSQGEFEVEGSEAFVERYAERIDALFADFQQSRISQPPVIQAAAAEAVEGNGHATMETPDHIGEWLEHLPRSSTDVDRMLLAGYFAQLRSGDQSFGTGEANTLLTDQGIKVGNPSQCVKQNLVAKRVFRHQRRYRVSQTGLDQLRQLLGPIFRT